MTQNLWPLVLILGSLVAFGSLSIDMYLPALPQIAQELATSLDHVQLSLTAFFIGMASGQIFVGPLADRYGRKKPLYFGLVIYAIASIACAAAPTVEMLIIARFFQACGACAGGLVARAIVRDLFNYQEAARVLSLLMLIMGVAPILAPLLGGYVAEAIGWRAIFQILAVFGLSCLIAVVTTLPESKGPNPAIKISSILPNYLKILKDRNFLLYTLVGGLASASMFAYITGSPAVFIKFYQLTPTQYGWLFGSNACALIAASQLNVKILKKQNVVEVLQKVLAVLVLLSLLLLFFTFVDLGFWGLIIPLFLYVGVLGMTFPNANALALAQQGEHAGSASALLGTIQFSLAALSSALVSVLPSKSGAPMVEIICACALLAFIIGRFAVKKAH